MTAHSPAVTTNPATVVSAALMPVTSILLILSVAAPNVYAAVAALVIGSIGTGFGVAACYDRRKRNPRLAASAVITDAMLTATACGLLLITGWLT